uniref:Aldedh domain-containing protein n=1 Tax=Ascaris lumbricoides TaxID=6252 RepID=A0A0M3ICX8_ASCLU
MNIAYTAACRLRAGNIYVNTYNDTNAMVPFGGMRQSGFGRENGVAALEAFSQIKSVFVNASKKLDNPFLVPNGINLESFPLLHQFTLHFTTIHPFACDLTIGSDVKRPQNQDR